MPEPGGDIITEKVGPLPLVAWVAGGAGLIFLLILMTHRGSNSSAQSNQTNQVSSLAPTEAEAFGTIEQQQQDVTNALTTMGNNQSALGGSINTLSGMETSNWANANTQFGNVLSGQQQLSSQMTAGQQQIQASQQDLMSQLATGIQGLQGGITGLQGGQQQLSAAQASYFNQIQSALSNYYGALQGSLNGVNSNLQTQIAVGNQTTQQQLRSYYTALYDQIVGARYVDMGTATAVTAGANDPRVLQWLQLANQVTSQPGSTAA
jgi:hypothetical protein